MQRTRIPARRLAPRPRLGVQQLEDRTVPTVGFLSALGVGNDTDSSGVGAIAVDAVGNSYLIGGFSGTVDFDPARTHAGDADILTARGGNDAFVAKYAPDNSLIWARRMGGDASDGGSKIALDGSGNVYITGDFRETADFGSFVLTSAGGTDGFVAKLSPDGTVQWVNRWGGETSDGGRGVGVDASGNVYVLGVRNGFGTEVESGHDILKFSPTGSVAWAKSINSGYSWGSDLAVDAQGNVFVAGNFTGTVDFDPGPKTAYASTSAGGGFVLKLTSAGNFGWVAPFKSRDNGTFYGRATASSIALDGAGNILVGGSYNHLVDFDPGFGTTTLPDTGVYCGYIAKLNSQGALVWARALENVSSGGSVNVNDLAVDAWGDIYATGYLTNSPLGDVAVDFDPGPGTHIRTSAGQHDIYVLKLTSAGTFAWVETFGGTGTDIGSGIAVDTAGTVYLTGRYTGTVDFDPDPLANYDLTTPGTKSNFFLVKLSQSDYTPPPPSNPPPGKGPKK